MMSRCRSPQQSILLVLSEPRRQVARSGYACHVGRALLYHCWACVAGLPSPLLCIAAASHSCSQLQLMQE